MLSGHPDSDRFIEEYRRIRGTHPDIVEALTLTGETFYWEHLEGQPPNQEEWLPHRRSPHPLGALLSTLAIPEKTPVSEKTSSRQLVNRGNLPTRRKRWPSLYIYESTPIKAF